MWYTNDVLGGNMTSSKKKIFVIRKWNQIITNKWMSWPEQKWIYDNNNDKSGWETWEHHSYHSASDECSWVKCDELSTTGQADGLCYCLYNITVDKVIRQNETLGRS